VVMHFKKRKCIMDPEFTNHQSSICESTNTSPTPFFGAGQPHHRRAQTFAEQCKMRQEAASKNLIETARRMSIDGNGEKRVCCREN